MRTKVLFAAMCLIWGVPYLLIRVAVRDVSPPMLVFARTAIGAVVLLPFALRSNAIKPVLRHWRSVAVFTLAEIALPWLLLNDAETRISSSMSGLLIAAVPLVGVVLARYGPAHEQVGPTRLLGVCVGMAGVAVLLGLDVTAVHTRAMAEMAFVVIGYAVAPVILSRKLGDVAGIGVVFCSLAMCALAYSPVLIMGRPQHLHLTALASILCLGVICTAVAFVVFFELIAAIGPSRAVVITFVNPAVAVSLGVLLLGEQLTWGIGAGFALILLGCVLAARSSAQKVTTTQTIAASEAAGR